jgi:hypothetical protein
MTETNDLLSPKELKVILMGTVDKKDFLKGKVLSEGVVNEARAIKAASYAKSLSVKKAIAQSFKDIPVLRSKSEKSQSSSLNIEMKVAKIPSLFH